MFSAVKQSDMGYRPSIFIEKGFLGGVAMAAPFYAEFFSWRWAVLLAVPLFVLLLIRREKTKQPNMAILPMVFLLVLHVVALVFSQTVFAGQVVKDLVVASFLLFVYVLADEDTLAGFFSVLIPLAVITALLGLLKAGLLDRGYLLGFITDGCSYYPAGSALCVNYNNLGLLWLVAALGCIRTSFWWCIPFLLVAGVLSTSRRFILLMSFIPFVWIILQGRMAIVKVLSVVIASGILFFAITDPTSFDNYRQGETPFKVLEFSSGAGQEDVAKKINRAAPMLILGSMTDGTLGTATRLSFWQLGASLVSWAPQGFGYHEVFACKFSACTDFHYPHMPVISEWIIGGVLFAVVALAFFVWPFLQILSARRLFPVALFLLVMPYVLISGDTVFSLPICISCMLVALSTVERSTRSFRD
jgi:hypothetical protein